MLQIFFLSYSLPQLLAVTFGKKNTTSQLQQQQPPPDRGEASWNTFNTSAQPTEWETLVWWSEPIAGRQAFQLVAGSVADSLHVIDQVT